MNINSPAEDKIIVELTEQDMLGLEITYEEMDYSTIETRRVIWTLLDEAGKALGRELDPTRKMIIEAMPKNGGCILSFTILENRKKYLPQKQLLKKHSQNIICEFDCIDSLYSAAKSLGKDFYPESSLYELGGKDLPAVGVGLGVEHLLMLLEKNDKIKFSARRTIISATEQTTSRHCRHRRKRKRMRR